jgi:AraC-like DNA-binding protein
MPFWEIPENAVRAFEEQHRLRVTVHDLQGALWPFLSPDRFQHMSPVCQAVKALPGGSERCVRFDIAQVRRDLPEFPEGRVHLCHAGLVEWVVPLFGESALEQVLFAGVRLPGRGIERPRGGGGSLTPLNMAAGDASTPLPTVSAEESAGILELLRQLAARLQMWKRDAARESGMDGAAMRPGPGSGAADLVSARRPAIARFLHARHRDPDVTLAHLADLLGVSESRASHLVRELFGRSFRDLLIDARLQTASGLLRHSGLSVLEIGLHSGFSDAAHFHRMFRQRMTTSPARYRTRSIP